jgi:hypothetical protein
MDPRDDGGANFVAEVFAATDRALTSPERSIHHLDVAGVPIVVEFANTGIRDLFMPALHHLEDPPATAGQPEVTLQMWDSASTAVAMPAPPVPRDAFNARGEILGFDGERHLIALQTMEGAVSLLDRDAGRGVYWVQDAQNLPYWSRSAPLRTLLHWILMARERHLVHGAVVGDEKSGVLLVGNGGIGKSTTALRCLAGGMKFLGDDYVAIAADPPRAYSLYSTAKLFPADSRPAGRPLSPSPDQNVTDPSPDEDEKVVLTLGDYREQLPRELPVRAMATLVFADDEASSVEDIDSSALVQAALLTTLAQLPHAGAPLLRLLRDFKAQVTTARVKLGRDPESVVSVIRELAAGQPKIREADESTLISVVIPVHNGARFLPEAIGSVLAQDHEPLELIVVDDGSTDDLERVVADLPVEVTYLRQSQQGPAAARNAGIRAARGDIVAFLDVDDLWPPGVLRELLRGIVAHECEVVAGWTQMARYDQTTGTTAPYGKPEESYPYYIGAALYRRSVFDAVGLFDPDMRCGEDTDWYARFHECGRIMHRLPLTALVHRTHGGNMTRGQDAVGLGVVRAVKNSLDRRRLRDA